MEHGTADRVILDGADIDAHESLPCSEADTAERAAVAVAHHIESLTITRGGAQLDAEPAAYTVTMSNSWSLYYVARSAQRPGPA